MEKFVIEGGVPLCGELTVAGNKNAALPILAACLLTEEEVLLHRVPRIRDTEAQIALLERLGVAVEWVADNSVRLCAREVSEPAVDEELSSKIRASFLPEMKPMWPASFGGQSSAWVENERLFVFGEGLRRHAAVLGSPAFVRASDQVGHQLPDRTVLAEMDIPPEIAMTFMTKGVAQAQRGGQSTVSWFTEKLNGVLVSIPEYTKMIKAFHAAERKGDAEAKASGIK